MRLIDELKRRNVIRVAVAYLAGAWLLIQVLETLFPIFGLAETSIRVVVILLVIGFVPALITSWVFELTPSGLKKDGKALAERTNTRKLDRAIIIVLTIAVGYFAVDKFIFEKNRPGQIVASYGDKKVVVLPFDNLTGDPSEDYLSFGMAEELLEFLQRVPELVVVSRTTGQLLKEDNLSVADIAEKINATHVLEGSFRKSGDRYRVTAQLIAASEDAHLFSETYDRQPVDVLNLQTEIAARVTDALAVELVYPPKPTDNLDPEAYKNFLRARFLHQNAVDTEESMRETIALLTRTVELEPDWAPGVSELTRAYWRKANHSGPKVREEMLAKIDRLVTRLHEIEPQGQDSNGWSSWLAWRIDQDYYNAARFAEASLRANPYDLDMLRVTTILFAKMRRDEEAIIVGKYVLDHDPACDACINTIAYVLREIGRYREAAVELEAMLEWYQADDNKRWQIGAAWIGAGEPQRALDYFNQMEAESFRVFARLFALYALGQTETFESEFAALRERPETTVESIMRVYAWSRQLDKAFDLLDDMVAANGAIRTFELLQSQFYVHLRADPRWQEFLKQHQIDDNPVTAVPFDPQLPAVIQAEIDDQRQSAGGTSRP